MTGSTRVARRAGPRQATSETNASTDGHARENRWIERSDAVQLRDDEPAQQHGADDAGARPTPTRTSPSRSTNPRTPDSAPRTSRNEAHAGRGLIVGSPLMKSLSVSDAPDEAYLGDPTSDQVPVIWPRRHVPSTCACAVRCSMSTSVFRLASLMSACHVPVIGGDCPRPDATRADHVPRQPARSFSAAHVPCSRSRFASIRVHVPCATFGVFGSIAAVHVP